MKVVKLLLLFTFLCIQNLNSNAQQKEISFLRDSLKYYLDYFHQNTNSTVFIQALEKARVFNNNDIITDSLAASLIDAEAIMLHLIEDSSCLNVHPFKQEMIFSFAGLLVNIFQSLTPQKESLYYAGALSNLGILYKGKWQHTKSDDVKALSLFKKALSIRTKKLTEEKTGYVESIKNLVLIYQSQKEIEKAKAMLLRLLAITKGITGKENIAYADDLFTLAAVCNQMKLYDTARLLFEQEINLRKKILGEENSNYGLQLYRTAEMMMYLLQYQQAYIYYQQALNVTQKTSGDGNIQYAYCLEGIAGYYYITAQYRQAIPLYLQVLEIKEKLYGKNYYDNALTLHNLATAYFRMGNYEKAIPFLQQVINIQKKTSTIPENYAYELNWLGLLYQNISNYDKALSYYNQALKMPEYKEAKQRYANTLNNIAAVYEKQNKNALALSYLKQSMFIIKNVSGETSPDYAGVIFSVAVLSEKLHNYTAAIKSCHQALLIRKNLYGEMHPQYAACLMLLGKIYTQTKNFDSAESCFVQALEIQKNILGEEHPDYINCLNNLALLKTAQHKNAEAASEFISANQLELKYISRVYTSLSEQEKLEFENDQYYQFSYLPSLIYKYDIKQPKLLQQLYANELALKGMVLNDQQSLLNSIRKSNDTAALNLYNEWRVNKIMLGKQLLLPKDERPGSFESLQETTTILEEKLSNISVAFRQQQQMLTAQQISEKLLQHAAAIEFVKFQLYSNRWTDTIVYAALIVLPGDSIPEFIPLFKETQLADLLNKSGKNENAINRFYASAINNEQIANTGDLLYKLIWKPLEKYLKGIDTIYYSPAGLLHRIAFHALPVDSFHCLIDKYHLQQMLSTRSVASPVLLTQKPSSVSIWGDIQYDRKNYKAADTQVHQIAQRSRGADVDIAASYYRDTTKLPLRKWSALDGTRVEMDSIKKLFINTGISVSTTADTSATEEVFKALDAKSPQVLHIATHGFFWSANDKSTNSFAMQQDPMFRSGLVLAGGNEIWTDKKIAGKDDGILTSYEIAQLDLSNTDLVVLSACETALGDLYNNEGVIGLQRAFKLAGVKQIIISLWRVPDRQTAELMTMFYRNWLNGESARDALRSAQLNMKEKYPPFYWAAFVLVE